MASAAGISAPERVANRYRVLHRIAAGTTGGVFAALDERTGTTVAVKVLVREESAPDSLLHMQHEAAVLSVLNHPHIVKVHGASIDDCAATLVMELIEGRSLGVLMQTEALDLRRIKHIVAQVADALAHAHAHGIVHRDIKPHNIVVSAGDRVTLTDFGIAQFAAAPSASDPRRAPYTSGTPLYMAPEQIAGEPVDGRADIYALGCMLYELVTGGPPFTGLDAETVSRRHLAESPLPPRRIRPDLPADWQDLILLCLAKHPEQRFASAPALHRAVLSLSDPEVQKRTGCPLEVTQRAEAAGRESARHGSACRPAMQRRTARAWTLSGLAGAAVLALALLAGHAAVGTQSPATSRPAQVQAYAPASWTVRADHGGSMPSLVLARAGLSPAAGSAHVTAP